MRTDHVGVYLRGGNIIVTKQFLNAADIGTALQKVGSKTVAKSMATGLLAYSRGTNGIVHCTADLLLANVMAAPNA